MRALAFLLSSTCLFFLVACGEEANQTPSGGGGNVPMTFPEVCDGMDNDLDGRIDEGNLQRACSTSCGGGIERCQAGRWAGCTAPQPEQEMCDNRDNDCDGRLDEQLTRMCSNQCGDGQESCSGGNWAQCNAPSPTGEVCDNVDNDCDGQTDENLFRRCSVDCSMGNEACEFGRWSECDAREPGQEICGDGLDNDCDDDVDERCECTEGEIESCSTDVGVCDRGSMVCGSNGQWGACRDPGGSEVTLPGALEEQCNGIDDDCNGVTDDLVADQCGESDEGECSFGIWSCNNGARSCVGEVRPSEEVCDALDNDCDGDVDEELEVDFFEVNDLCRRAEVLPSIPDDTENPTNISASLYPDGDVDHYSILVQEGSDLGRCILFSDDRDFQITARLSNVPPGAQYRACFAFLRHNAILTDVCPEGAVEWRCPEPVGRDQVQSVTHSVRGLCGSNDSVKVLVRVTAEEESVYACQPYTLSFESEEIDLGP